jgi:hypothetical protein
MPIVVLEISLEDLLQVTTANDQQPVQALSADDTDPPLRVGVRVRRLDGRNEHSAPSARNTSSKPRQKFASRSRTRKRTRQPRSASTKSRLRGCWVTQALLGWQSRQRGGPGEGRVR